MRDEVKLYKRTRIVEEASKLFYERGYDATSVDMLAGELGVTKPFIYSYFDNKRAILEAVHEEAAHRVLGHIEQAAQAPGAPDARLRRFIELYVDENIKHQIASAIYLQEEKNLSPEIAETVRTIERKFNKILADMIQEGIDAGIYSIQDAKMASLCISGMVRWVHRWYDPDGRLPPAEIASTISEFALNMVGLKKRPRRK
ncbi:MAG: TetR/AcrR family transcriptional regulator [Burkholderiaceae bacterium]